MKTTDYKAIRYIVFLLIIVVFSSNKVIGQYEKELALSKFKKAYEAFKKKDYNYADSLYNVSIKLCPMPEAFYNLAMTKRFLKDVCGYCNNLDSAVLYGDDDAKNLFRKNCIKYDSIVYDNTLHPDTFCYSITETETCSNKRKINFYMKDPYTDKFYIFNDSEDDYIITKAQYTKYFPSNRNPKCKDMKNNVIIEEMPQFPGGEEALRDYIGKNLKYPDLAKENGIYGKVFVYFVINGDGNAEQIIVKRKVNPLIDAEAVRVIKNMPKWKPGMQCGKAVKVAFTVPINFALN